MEFDRAYHLLPYVVPLSKTWTTQKRHHVCCYFNFVDLGVLGWNCWIHWKIATFLRLWSGQDARLLQWRGVGDAATCLGWHNNSLYIPWPPGNWTQFLGSLFVGSLVNWLRWICSTAQTSYDSMHAPVFWIANTNSTTNDRPEGYFWSARNVVGNCEVEASRVLMNASWTLDIIAFLTIFQATKIHGYY